MYVGNSFISMFSEQFLRAKAATAFSAS